MRLLKILLVGVLVVAGLTCPALAVSQSVQDAVNQANGAINNNDPTLAASVLKGVLAQNMTEEDRSAVESTLGAWYDICNAKATTDEKNLCLSSLRSVGDQMKSLGLAVNENFTTPPSKTLTGGPGVGATPPGASVGQGGGGGTPASKP